MDVRSLSDAPDVVMLAAGSGITPMVRIIQHRHQQKRFPTIFHRLLCEKPSSFRASTLLFFNRQRADLIGGALFNPSFYDSHLVVRNVLSEETDVKNGELKGRINRDLLEGSLSTPFKDTQFFVCGPEGFNIAAIK